MESETASITSPFDGVHAETIVRVIEASIGVYRRYQFFVWSQSSLQLLLPHQLAICGAYRRTRKQVQLEVFNSISVSPVVLGHLADGQSAFMQRVVGSWIDNHGKVLALDIASLSGRSIEEARDQLIAAGLVELLVHGVSRPQRLNEVESVFILATLNERSTERQRLCLDLLIPHLHSTYLRVQAVEREMNDAVPQASSRDNPRRSTITERERQILGWVREGMSNQQIGSELEISPLTVKNHVQKILRKLGASNRAHAVARAMTLNLLGRPMNDS